MAQEASCGFCSTMLAGRCTQCGRVAETPWSKCRCGQPLADFPSAFMAGQCLVCYQAERTPLTWRHESVLSVLRYFDSTHLTGRLQLVSRRFETLARQLAADEELTGPELTVALRKLLEAKDAAVRSALDD